MISVLLLQWEACQVITRVENWRAYWELGGWDWGRGSSHTSLEVHWRIPYCGPVHQDSTGQSCRNDLASNSNIRPIRTLFQVCPFLNCFFFQEIQSLLKERLECLRLRTSQFMLPFSFWPAPEPRTGNNIYEIRSYSLKPGTMIEWGNNWARAINYRQHNSEAFAGFFSQIGRLYHVHHIWCKWRN